MAEILHKDLLGDDIHELRVTIGSSAPTSTPLFVGQGYYDIVNKKFYVATGTSSTVDWITTEIPAFLIFSDTRTITWTSNQVGDEITYQANVDEAELILTASNITDFGTAVLTLPEVVSLLADQHTRLIMRTGSEPGGWNPVVQDGLELDPDAQKIRLSQDLSEFGDPQFDEVTLITRSTTPLLTLTAGGTPTAASAFLDTTKGMVVRGDVGSASSFTLQNEAGTDVLSNPVSTNQLVAPSLAAGAGAPGVVHADSVGLLSTSKLVDADVDVAAAIVGTKISPDFGSQNITTTGSVLVDTIESNTDDIGILTGNANKTIAIGTGNGYNTINIGGVNSTVNISGATYITPVEYVSEDKNIIVNFNASGQDSADSGLYVQEQYAGALIDLLDATWQSGNTVRYSVDPGGSGIDGLVASEYVRISDFANSQNNGTFKVLVTNSSYIDVINPQRTNATLDEAGVTAANAARLLVNGYIHVGSTRASWEVKAPAHLGIIELKPQSAAKTLLITSESVNNVTVKFNTDLTIDQDVQKTASVEFSNLKISSLTTGIAHLDSDGDVSSSLIVNADVDGTAAIAGTKISPDFGSQDITTTGHASVSSVKVTGAEAISGSNFYKSATNGLMIRGIAGTLSEVKIINELGTNLVTIEGSGQTTLHHLSTTGVVKSTSGVLSSNLLVNADVDAAAAIAGTKISSDFGSQSVTTSGNISTTGTGTITSAGLLSANSKLIVADNSSGDAVRITQTGSGNALVVEDSTNPDSTPFVIDADGNVNIGSTASFGKLSAISGSAFFSVAPATDVSAVVGQRPANDGYSSLLLSYGNTTNYSTNMWKFNASSTEFSLYQNATQQLNIDASGNLQVNNGNISVIANKGIESSSSGALNIGTTTNTTTLNLGTGANVATVNIGTGAAATNINLGGANDTVNVLGTLSFSTITVSGLATFSGGQKVKVGSLVAANYIATTSDYIVQVNTTAGAFNITLPSASASGSGTVLIVKDARSNADVNNITVLPNGADTIDGEASYIVQEINSAVKLVSDGVSRWLII